MTELQGLLDEWLIAAWQNRPHDGLRDPAAPGRAFTPNEKYAALVEAAGYVPVALSAGDYIELLPAAWRAINAYGVKISHRVYDSEELNPFRGQRSGVTARQNLWEIHRDPYDVSRIWVRNHWDGGWITVFWKHLSTAPAPFGELAWDHARQKLAAGGGDLAEEEIAQAVGSLLQRAHQGPGKTRPSRPQARRQRPPGRRPHQGHRATGLASARTPGRTFRQRACAAPAETSRPARRQARRCRAAGGLRRPGGGQEMVVAGTAQEAGGRCLEPTTTLSGWRQFVDAAPATFDLLPDAAWASLTASEQGGL